MLPAKAPLFFFRPSSFVLRPLPSLPAPRGSLRTTRSRRVLLTALASGTYRIDLRGRFQPQNRSPVPPASAPLSAQPIQAVISPENAPAIQLDTRMTILPKCAAAS